MEKPLPSPVSTARGPEIALTDAAVQTVQINRVPGGGAACRRYVRLSISWPAFFLLTVQRARRRDVCRILSLPASPRLTPRRTRRAKDARTTCNKAAGNA